MEQLESTANRRSVVAGVAVVTLLVGLSVAIRAPEFRTPTGSENLEAPYHVLLTVRALGEGSGTDHWYLPTVSLGAPRDKHIPWGAAVPTPTGDYVYTSFPPAGFLAPFIAFRLTGVPPTTTSLCHFNALVGWVSALLLFLLLHWLLRRTGIPPWPAAAGAIAASLISIFSREALQTTGVSYWSHSLYQPILILSLHAAVRLIDRDLRAPGWRAAVYLLAFLGPLVEWTGYVYNAGLLVVLLATRRPGSGRTATAVAAASVAAALATLGHLGLAIGFRPALDALATRFAERSSSQGSLVALLAGYAASYGLFLVVLLLVLAAALPRPGRLAQGDAGTGTGRLLAFTLALATAPLAENVLLMQHATQFSFDRYKFVVPASILIAIGFARSRPRCRIALLVALLAASAQGIASYKSDLQRHARWPSIDAANRALAAAVAALDEDCSILTSNVEVRGYASLLFGRGVWERPGVRDSRELMKRTGACQALFVEGSPAYPDLPRYRRVTLIRPDGPTRVVYEARD